MSAVWKNNAPVEGQQLQDVCHVAQSCGDELWCWSRSGIQLFGVGKVDPTDLEGEGTSRWKRVDGIYFLQVGGDTSPLSCYALAQDFPFFFHVFHLFRFCLHVRGDDGLTITFSDEKSAARLDGVLLISQALSKSSELFSDSGFGIVNGFNVILGLSEAIV